MRTVWKFDLRLGEQFIPMPQGAQVLYAEEQRSGGVLYALVDTTQPTQQRRVTVVPTGAEFDVGPAQPAGIIKLSGGQLMFHVFVWPEAPARDPELREDSF